MWARVDGTFYQGCKWKDRDRVWEKVSKVSWGDDCGMEQCRD